MNLKFGQTVAVVDVAAVAFAVDASADCAHMSCIAQSGACL